MAVVPAPPIPISGPGIYPIPYPGGGTQPTGASHQWTQIKLENASPFPLTFSLGGTPVHSIPAGVADVFALTLGPSGPEAPPTAGVDAPAQPLTVVAGAAQSPNTQILGYLRPSFGQYGDQFPGVYPVTLPGNLFAPALTPSAGSVLAVTSFSIPASGSGYSPVVDVHYMAEILIESSCSGSPPSIWTVTWFADAAGLVPSGGSFSWNVGTSNGHLLLLAPQGPYCQISAQSITPGAQGASAQITGFPTTPDRAGVLPPQVTLDIDTLSVPAGTTVGPYFTGGVPYRPGRYRVWVSSTGQGFWRISRYSSAGALEYLWQLSATTAGQTLTDEIILPADDWVGYIANTGAAAATFWFKVTGPDY